MDKRNIIYSDAEQWLKNDISAIDMRDTTPIVPTGANQVPPLENEPKTSKIIPLTEQELRLIVYLGRYYAHETYIRWKDLYLRQDLFEGRKIGEIFALIGGKDTSHNQRIRKVRNASESMTTWKSKEDIMDIKEANLQRALKSKAKKRLESMRKSMKLHEYE